MCQKKGRGSWLTHSAFQSAWPPPSPPTATCLPHSEAVHSQSPTQNQQPSWWPLKEAMGGWEGGRKRRRGREGLSAKWWANIQLTRNKRCHINFFTLTPPRGFIVISALLSMKTLHCFRIQAADVIAYQNSSHLALTSSTQRQQNACTWSHIHSHTLAKKKFFFYLDIMRSTH